MRMHSYFSCLMTKPSKILCAQWKISLGIRPVFAMRSMGSQGPKLSSCQQRRLLSDWADAQADPSLRWAHMPFCWFCHEVAQLWRAIYLKLPLVPFIVRVNSEGSGKTAGIRSRSWAFAVHLLDTFSHELAHLMVWLTDPLMGYYVKMTCAWNLNETYKSTMPIVMKAELFVLMLF